MGKLNIFPTQLNDAFVVETIPFRDQRGSFHRFFCSEELQNILNGKEIRAVNFSHSKDVGTVRGLHLQTAPFAEIKMVRCLRGKVFDVMVDLRAESETYLQWHSEILTPDNYKMMFIPERFAHGFQVLEEDSELLYLHTAQYSKECEAGIRYDDPQINIEWPLNPYGISKRDSNLPYIDHLSQGVEL